MSHRQELADKLQLDEWDGEILALFALKRIEELERIQAECVSDATRCERERCAAIASDYQQQATRERWHGDNIAGRTAAAIETMIRRSP